MRYLLTEYDTLGAHTKEISRHEAIKALSAKDFNAEHTLSALEENVRVANAPLVTHEWGFKLSVTPLSGLG